MSNMSGLKPRNNIHQMVEGTFAIPNNMRLGADCNKHHGTAGKTVRYKSSNQCILCNHQSHAKHLDKYDEEKYKTKALARKAFEAAQEQKRINAENAFLY